MSVASGASSVSVSLNGETMNLETALDTVVRDLQKHLNLVQLHLRMIGMGSERGDDFQEMINEADQIQNGIVEMNFLFQDLYDMAYEIVGSPANPEEKAFLRQHKLDRKLEIKKIKDDHAAAKKLEKASMKSNPMETTNDETSV